MTMILLSADQQKARVRTLASSYARCAVEIDAPVV